MSDSLPIERQLAEESELWPRGDENYSRRRLLPHDDTSLDMVSKIIFAISRIIKVYFCRGSYSIRSKKIITVGLKKLGMTNSVLQCQNND